MMVQETITFLAPDLARNPILGGGCCAVASNWLVEETVSGLPGIHYVKADDEHGEVVVSFDPTKISLQSIAAALEGLGFPPTDGVPLEPEPSS